MYGSPENASKTANANIISIDLAMSAFIVILTGCKQTFGDVSLQ